MNTKIGVLRTELIKIMWEEQSEKNKLYDFEDEESDNDDHT